MRPTSGSVNNIVFRDEGRDFSVLCALVARLLLRRLLFALLASLLGRAAASACAAIVVVLILAVLALCIVLGPALQRTATSGPGALALTVAPVLSPGLTGLSLVPIPVSVSVPLFLPLLLFIGRHDPPRAFLSPLTAGPP